MTSSRRRIPINNHASADEAPAEGAPPRNGGTGADDPQAAQPGMSRSGGKEPVAQDPPVTDLRVGETALLEAETALEKATGERDALADSLLRLRAEFENFRKRASRESVQSWERAQGELLGELLPVLDNLERALDAAEHHEEGKVLAGVRMTRDMFVDLLGRRGVEEIEAVGAKFDPVVHDAMLLQPSDSEEGTVTAVLERGYRQGDHVLRPARVAVSSGPGAPDGPATAA